MFLKRKAHARLPIRAVSRVHRIPLIRAGKAVNKHRSAANAARFVFDTRPKTGSISIPKALVKCVLRRFFASIPSPPTEMAADGGRLPAPKNATREHCNDMFN